MNNTDIFDTTDLEGVMFLHEDDLKVIKAIEDIEEDSYYEDFLVTETFLFTQQEDY